MNKPNKERVIEILETEYHTSGNMLFSSVVDNFINHPEISSLFDTATSEGNGEWISVGKCKHGNDKVLTFEVGKNAKEYFDNNCKRYYD